METLFITPKYLTENTHLDGDTDSVNYNFHIANVQMTIIERMLGTELYDKILSDFEGDTLTGLYLKLFEDYVKPVTKYSSVAKYISSPYKVGKGGVYKATGEDRENLTKEEKDVFESEYNSMAQIYLNRFEKFIKKNRNSIPEYKTTQEEVDAENQQVITDIRFI